jgi:hypothetical protein
VIQDRVDAPRQLEEDKRQLAARLVNALYRVIKGCQLHSEHNQAVLQVIDQAVSTTQQFCETSGVRSASILFTPHAVFINRQMLRASKETYQLALELGQLLLTCEATEITVGSDVSGIQIGEFGRAVANASRDGSIPDVVKSGGWDSLKLRKVTGLGGEGKVAPQIRAARTYAAALMIIKSFYSELKERNYEPRQGVKRVAQKLVSQSELEGRLLLSIAAVPSVDADRSQSLLSTAIVAHAMACQLTNDRTLLSAIVTTALLYDVGRPRMLRADAPSRQLTEDEEALQTASSVVAVTALGKLHPPNLIRAVLLYETHALKNNLVLYRGKRTPLLASRILLLARAFVELRTPTATAQALSLDDAVQVLDAQASDNTGRALVKLLVGALGLFPAGTMVELSTGEMGVVLATPRLPVDFARPPVRVLYDEHAQLLPEPLDIDLALPVGVDGKARTIRKAIDSTDQQMRQMRAYVMQVAAKRARKPAPPEPASVSRDFGSSDVSSGFGSSSDASSASAHAGRGVSSMPAPSLARSAPPDSSQGVERAAHRVAPSEPPAPRAVQDAIPASMARPQKRSASLTQRWDPRSEAAGEGAPALGPGLTPPPPPGVDLEAEAAAVKLPAGGATRSVSWGEIGKELERASRPDDDTDSILAAYLADDGNRTSSHGDPSANRSWGLRWTSGGKSASFDTMGSSSGRSPSERDSSAGPSSADSKSGRPTEPPSMGGRALGTPSEDDAPWDDIFAKAPTSTKETRRSLAPIETSAPSAVPGAPASALRPLSSAGNPDPPAPTAAAPPPSIPRVGAVPAPVFRESPTSNRRGATASSWAAPKSKPQEPVESPKVEEAAPASIAEPPTSVESRERRAKAGSSAWGAAKRDQKK